MKKCFTFILVAVTLHLLTACTAGGGSPAAAQAPIEITDTWSMNITQSNDKATVENQRRIILAGPEIVGLINGSSLLEPAKLESHLLERGAGSAKCMVKEKTAEIRLDCQTTQTIEVDDSRLIVPLPDRAILHPARLLAVETGSAVSLHQAGDIKITLPVAGLPETHHKVYANPGFYRQRIRLRLPSILHFEVQEYLPAGTIVTQPQEKNILTLWSDYHLPQTSWWFLGGALLIALYTITLAFPVRSHFFATNKSEDLDNPHLPEYVQRVIVVVTTTIHRLREVWPQLVTNLLGLLLFFSGLFIFILAWILAPVLNFLTGSKEKLAAMLDGLPVVWSSLELELWMASVLLLAGIGLLVLGLGIWLRQEWARLLLLSLLLGPFLSWIIIWPDLLLQPPAIPGQTGLIWLVGGLFCLLLALSIYALRLPDTRRGFLRGDL